MPDRDLALSRSGAGVRRRGARGRRRNAIREARATSGTRLDLRPYLRARSGYGEMLLISGRVDEARATCSTSRSIRPTPMGVGYPLLRGLLAEQRHDAAQGW